MIDPSSQLTSALGDRYEIRGELGAGGMATVFDAYDLRHDRDVALKVFRSEVVEAVGSERFLREIQITASLAHPNIRPLLDSGNASGILYYVMPLVRGETLKEQIDRDGPLDLDSALRISLELAAALEYAHEAGIVHRDVKPANVFIESGIAILSDFGIALALDAADGERLTDSGVFMGTAEYMSPEQCAGGKTIGPQADIYSLGCLIFEMLTGEPPFRGRTRLAVVSKQITEPAPQVAVLRPDVPEILDTIVARCLAKTPADRGPSVATLRSGLEQAMEKWTAGKTRPARLRSRLPVRTRARWWGTVAAASVALTAGLWWMNQSALPDMTPEKVVVFPFAERGSVTDQGGDVALMIGNALLHTDPLRWIDGWQHLSTDERADASLIDLERARDVARGVGAKHFILGGITETADALTVLMTLHDAQGDSVLGQASASAGRGEYTTDQLGIRAVIDLLPALLDPGREVPDLSFLVERNPAAIAFWIQGDKEYRGARFPAALELYRNAVSLDPLLSLAALKGAQAASWSGQLDVAEDLVALSIEHDSLLPPRYQEYGRGWRAYLAGDADEAVERMEAAIKMDREWGEAWTALGDVYTHLLPSRLDVERSARDAFERAVEVDPDFAPALLHLAEQALRRGDLDAARDLMETIRAADPRFSSQLPHALELMLECVESGADAMDWTTTARSDPEVVLEAAQQLAVGGAALRCAETGLRTVLVARGGQADQALRWSAVVGLQSILVAQGHDAEAAALLDETEKSGISAALFLYVIDAIAGADMTAQAKRVEDIADSSWGPTYEVPGPLTLWLIGAWKAHVGAIDELEVIRDRMRQLADERGDAETLELSKALDAHYALATGDTATARDGFRSLVTKAPPAELGFHLAQGFQIERSILSGLLLSQGEFAEAYRTASVFDHPQPGLFVPFLPANLVVRYQAASQLEGADWRRRAAKARSRLERMGRLSLLAPPP